MFKLFKKRASALPLMAPASGSVMALEAVGDPVFAGKMMGDGFGVEPADGAIVSPISGMVTMVADTGHGIGIRSDDGLEVLIHMGIDTVDLKGAPFMVAVSVDQQVQTGQPLAMMDLDAILAAGKASTVMVVITNTTECGVVATPLQGFVTAGDTAATYTITEA